MITTADNVHNNKDTMEYVCLWEVLYKQTNKQTSHNIFVITHLLNVNGKGKINALRPHIIENVQCLLNSG